MRTDVGGVLVEATSPPPSFRGAQWRAFGALLREPGIHNHDREYGFRACAPVGYRRLKTHPGMTLKEYGRIPPKP
jgi:hypothetical protein